MKPRAGILRMTIRDKKYLYVSVDLNDVRCEVYASRMCLVICTIRASLSKRKVNTCIYITGVAAFYGEGQGTLPPITNEHNPWFGST